MRIHINVTCVAITAARHVASASNNAIWRVSVTILARRNKRMTAHGVNKTAVAVMAETSHRNVHGSVCGVWRKQMKAFSWRASN